jgi:hypothetical protein
MLLNGFQAAQQSSVVFMPILSFRPQIHTVFNIRVLCAGYVVVYSRHCFVGRGRTTKRTSTDHSYTPAGPPERALKCQLPSQPDLVGSHATISERAQRMHRGGCAPPCLEHAALHGTVHTKSPSNYMKHKLIKSKLAHELVINPWTPPQCQLIAPLCSHVATSAQAAATNGRMPASLDSPPRLHLQLPKFDSVRLHLAFRRPHVLWPSTLKLFLQPASLPPGSLTTIALGCEHRSSALVAG